MLHDLLDRRFLAVIGKGGTGKTAVTAALALLAASRGRRVLVAMAQSRERLSSMLETEYIDSQIVRVLPNIDAVNMDPQVCLEEYGLMVLRVRALYKAMMDNRIVRGFLRAVPGMDAWSMLGKALFHAKEQEGGRPRYDLVILDAPATGHGLQMLKVPSVICDLAPPGLLRREAEDGLATLRDPKAAGIIVVTLPEEMPTTETEELMGQLRNGLGMPVSALVVNQTLEELFGAPGEQVARAAEALSREAAFAPVGFAMRLRHDREHVQAAMLERLRALQTPMVTLPVCPTTLLRRADIEALARALEQQGV